MVAIGMEGWCDNDITCTCYGKGCVWVGFCMFTSLLDLWFLMFLSFYTPWERLSQNEVIYNLWCCILI